MSEWILCEDRLPDTAGEYLVTDLWRKEVCIYRFRRKDSGEEYWEHPILRLDFALSSNRIVAWMPLPKVYKPLSWMEKVLECMEEIGINLKAENDEYREPSDILQECAQKLNEYHD